jgi:hypothetical protein
VHVRAARPLPATLVGMTEGSGGRSGRLAAEGARFLLRRSGPEAPGDADIPGDGEAGMVDAAGLGAEAASEALSVTRPFRGGTVAAIHVRKPPTAVAIATTRFQHCDHQPSGGGCGLPGPLF